MSIGHEPTDLEKKSLEAHVDLCAQRYRFLESKMGAIEEKISSLNSVITEVHDMVHSMTEKRNDQLLNWSMGVGATLLGIIGYLLVTYVFV
jgi:predicted  nucleic acid-binding Zn-ribbon protein